MLSSTDILHRNVVLIDANEESGYKFKIVLGNIVLENGNGEILTRLNKHKVFTIFIVGRISITSVMLDYCYKNAIAVILVSKTFRVISFWSNSAEANFLLRKKQYSCENSILIASHIIKNKIKNQMLLLKDLRDKSDNLKDSIEKIANYMILCDRAESIDYLMGLEGNTAKLYFKHYFKDHNWQGRKPRVKLDVINVVLDIGYSCLFNYIECFIRLFGFDLYIGVLHQCWYKRKSFVCDMVEPFRVLIDKTIRKNFNLKTFKYEHFGIKKGQYYLKPEFIKLYSGSFFAILVEYKQDCFLYIRDYYRAFMRDKDIESYPKFTISIDNKE